MTLMYHGALFLFLIDQMSRLSSMSMSLNFEEDGIIKQEILNCHTYVNHLDQERCLRRVNVFLTYPNDNQTSCQGNLTLS